jgi:N-acetylneuraminic acid mutarotase
VRRLSETQKRVLLLSLVLVPGALLGLKLATGIGPDLPGPRVREVLGVVEPFGACTPRPDGVRVPAVPVAASFPAKWQREQDVEAFKDEEVRAAAAGGVVYAGIAARPNEEGTIFSALGTFYEYELGGGVSRLRPMPIPAHHSAIAVWKGDVYVFGGFTDGRASNRVWRYSPRQEKWRAMASMPRARGALAGGVIDDRFYAVGGASSALLQDPDVYGVLDVYDFRTDSWTRGPSMPTARHHLGAAAVEGRLYAVGGRGSHEAQALDALEAFDPSTKRWERLAPLPLGVGGLQAIGWKGRLIALSGGDDGDAQWVTPATWSYSPSTRSWTRLPDMRVPRHGFGAVVLAGRVYALGGSPCARYGATAAVESLALP